MLAARESLPPKLKVTFVPGCSSSNCLPSVVKLSFSDAAANTVTVPDSLSDEADATEPDLADEESPDDVQALRASSTVAPRAATCIGPRVRCSVRVITGPLPLVLTDTITSVRADHQRSRHPRSRHPGSGS